MNVPDLLFVAKHLLPEDVRDARILEVGSLDVNGSVRPIIERDAPREYIGVDIAAGPGVNIVCDAQGLVDRFGAGSFDIVISTELLEHVRDWREAVHQMKMVCKDGGIILVTTRSRGFPYHGFPHDYWRFEIADMREIFADCAIAALEPDPQRGVMLKAVKESPFTEKDLGGITLYSVVTGRRTGSITDRDMCSGSFRMRRRAVQLGEFLRRRVEALFMLR